MILVDTSVWIDYFNGRNNLHTDALDDAIASGIVAIGDLILLEILQGFRDDHAYRQAKRYLATLDNYNRANPVNWLALLSLLQAARRISKPDATHAWPAAEPAWQPPAPEVGAVGARPQPVGAASASKRPRSAPSARSAPVVG
jgi:predicted nucleic acid-binding protein